MIARSLEKKRSGEGGFTLVELLIVIVILGILAAIVVLAIGGLKGTASTAACKSGVKTIDSAEDAYYAASTPNAYATTAVLLDTAGTSVAGQLLKSDPADLDVVPDATHLWVITGTGDCNKIGPAAHPTTVNGDGS